MEATEPAPVEAVTGRFAVTRTVDSEQKTAGFEVAGAVESILAVDSEP